MVSDRCLARGHFLNGAKVGHHLLDCCWAGLALATVCRRPPLPLVVLVPQMLDVLAALPTHLIHLLAAEDPGVVGAVHTIEHDGG